MSIKIALVSCPTLEKAKEIARLLVESRLAACVNILPNAVSIYRWENKTEEQTEVLMLIKTADKRVKELEAKIHELHPYQVPEFVVLDSSQISEKYRSWVEQSV